MDFDIIVKIVAAVAGAIGVAKVYYELLVGKGTRMREEYKFAKEFFALLKSDEPLHPFVKEKGYQAISGNKNISLKEMEYLMSLKEPDLALRDYVLGKKHLEYVPHRRKYAPHRSGQIVFKKRYRSIWLRRVLKSFYSVAYFAMCIMTAIPFLIPRILIKDPNKISLPGILMVMTVCAFYAWGSLRAFARIVRAEKLVKHQEAV